jgi:hypothetical protein
VNFQVDPTPLAAEQIRRLDNQTYDALVSVRNDLEGNGCRSAGHRLVNGSDAPTDYCSRKFYRQWTVITRFPVLAEVLIVWVGEHAESATNIYAEAGSIDPRISNVGTRSDIPCC